ncbi:MFS transporter [Sphingomonas morindae]|uniref:MFS transporter n=1 Tax=Sphingomonas morindae TaxID=1541170 RepID=A0ABY4X4B0_9SPHN|nr:MFS transporter [Sphingomonas morindae]USI71724.1 MFS transporter [Sphingomonas morindae]
MDRRWPRIVALWLIGLLAAAQLAKFAVLAPQLRRLHRLDLAEMGLLISLMEVGGGLFGFVAGLALGRIGARRALLGGLALLCLSGAGEAVAPDAALLFLARGLEGVGYLLVVIAAPTLIVAVARPAERGTALALWSSFVPVGLALGSAVTGPLAHPLGIAGTLLLWSGAGLALLLLAARLPLADIAIAPRIALPRAAAWPATLGFGAYTLFVCALTMLLPSFLIEARGATTAEAGLIAGLASLAALPGSALAARIMARGPLSGARLLALIAPPTLIAALAMPLIFRLADRAASAALAVAALGLGAVAAPFLFGRLPLLAGARGPADPRIAAANGLLTQFGAGGALLGPPLGGLVVHRAGWTGLGLASALLAATMLLLVALAEAIHARAD